MNGTAFLLTLSALVATPALGHNVSPAVVDSPGDVAHPARQDAFVLPIKDGAVNAMVYLASGLGPHPTLLLLHGFPGNEQNLDLAQAARRAGWNVLTFHYRGSWGSPGTFSFHTAAEDVHAALTVLRTPGMTRKYSIDPTRIAVAGHSMGGFLGADAAADDLHVIGLFLIDAWDISHTASTLSTEQGRKNWHDEAVGDLPPLAGTSESALAQEMVAGGHRFSLSGRLAAFGNRPLAVYGASRGEGPENVGYMRAARDAGNAHVTGQVWSTDHAFSDKRIALSRALVAWLGSIAPH